MVSLDTQQQIVKVIMAIAKNERAVELQRLNLAQNPLFTPYTAFLRLDQNNNQYLNANDIKSFLE